MRFGYLTRMTAGAAKRLRFAPLAYILPIRHPRQLAEEIGILDHPSGGRFELGVGRGISPYELVSTASIRPRRRRDTGRLSPC